MRRLNRIPQIENLFIHPLGGYRFLALGISQTEFT